MAKISPPFHALDHEAIRAWLAGQREGAKVIARERRIYLENLNPKEAWKSYLALCRQTQPNWDLSQPSFVLFAMRKALSRRQEKSGDERF